MDEQEPPFDYSFGLRNVNIMSFSQVTNLREIRQLGCFVICTSLAALYLARNTKQINFNATAPLLGFLNTFYDRSYDRLYTSLNSRNPFTLDEGFVNRPVHVIPNCCFTMVGANEALRYLYERENQEQNFGNTAKCWTCQDDLGKLSILSGRDNVTFTTYPPQHCPPRRTERTMTRASRLIYMKGLTEHVCGLSNEFSQEDRVDFQVLLELIHGRMRALDIKTISARAKESLSFYGAIDDRLVDMFSSPEEDRVCCRETVNLDDALSPRIRPRVLSPMAEENAHDVSRLSLSERVLPNVDPEIRVLGVRAQQQSQSANLIEQDATSLYDGIIGLDAQPS